MMVEIPYNSFVKYEFDKKINTMRVDRVLHTAMAYPGNYGYFPNTLSGDGDPLDVLLICEYPIFPGIYVKVKIIGVLLTEDEQGADEKIIVVPNSKVDPNYTNINDITDLPQWTISKIKHFFAHYKDTETNKWVQVKDFKGREKAFQIYKQSCSNYSKNLNFLPNTVSSFDPFKFNSVAPTPQISHVGNIINNGHISPVPHNSITNNIL